MGPATVWGRGRTVTRGGASAVTSGGRTPGRGPDPPDTWLHDEVRPSVTWVPNEGGSAGTQLPWRQGQRWPTASRPAWGAPVLGWVPPAGRTVHWRQSGLPGPVRTCCRVGLPVKGLKTACLKQTRLDSTFVGSACVSRDLKRHASGSDHRCQCTGAGGRCSACQQRLLNCRDRFCVNSPERSSSPLLYKYIYAHTISNSGIRHLLTYYMYFVCKLYTIYIRYHLHLYIINISYLCWKILFIKFIHKMYYFMNKM